MFAPFVILTTLAQPCPGGACLPAVESPHPAVVRVINDLGRERSIGSGTLVFADSERAFVVSCGHLFTDGVGQVSVRFPNQKVLAARVLEVNRQSDLSLLRIAAPSVPAVQVADQPPRVGDPLVSAGYGPHGQYATNRGRALGYVSLDGRRHDVLELTGSARQGDSGGPIWTAGGQLAGVIFGTDGRRVDGAHCLRVRELLERHLGPKPPAEDNDRAQADKAVSDQTPSNPVSGLADQLAAALRKSGAPCQCDPRLSDRVAQLEKSRLDPPTAGAAPRASEDAAPTGSGPSWTFESLVKGKLTAILVGFGVPGTLAAIAAWLFMRRARKRLRAIVIHDQSPPPPQLVERDRQFVEIQVPTDRLGALEWAMDEYVKRNPGARPTIETIEAYAKQFQSATKRHTP
jgi:hypothetical protein